MQHMNRRERRRIAFGAAAGAVLLSTASVAYACTIFMGQMTVTGNAKGPDGKIHSVTVVGDPNGGMTYCGDPTGTGTLPAGTGHTYVNSVTPPDSNVEVSVAPTTGDCASQLPDAVYNVNFTDDPGAYTNVTDDTRQWQVDCMYYDGQTNPIIPRGVIKSVRHLGTMTVVGGIGYGDYNLGENLRANTAVDEAALCVSNQNTRTDGRSNAGLYGNQAPVTVI